MIRGDPMSKTKILLVDDDPNIRQLVNLYLVKEGFEVEMAERGDEAVKKVSMGEVLLKGASSRMTISVILKELTGSMQISPTFIVPANFPPSCLRAFSARPVSMICPFSTTAISSAERAYCIHLLISQNPMHEISDCSGIQKCYVCL